MKKNPINAWGAILVSIALAIFLYYLHTYEHYILCYLLLAGVLAGFMNYFYVFLNIPVEREGGQQGGVNAMAMDWERPNKTYWLALLGYITIGIAGAFLTPLIDAILDGLKGLEAAESEKEIYSSYWVLFGYGIMFGFGANRILTSVLNQVLKRVNVPGGNAAAPIAFRMMLSLTMATQFSMLHMWRN